MDIVESILNNQKYTKLIDQLSDETLLAIVKNDTLALETASKGITQIEPDKINDIDYLQHAADTMQKLAQKILEQRKKNKRV